MGPLGHSAAALAAVAAVPPGAALLVLRPHLRVGLRQRLGASFAPERPAPGAVWVHAASVGEVLAASRLVRELLARGHALCASAQTPAGRTLLGETFPSLPATLAPLDHPWAVRLALGRAAPRALVLVENELWPFWIRAAGERGIPVLSLSARLSERSLRRWQRAGGFARRTARSLAAVGARTEADAERLARLGVPPERLRVTGDLKLEPRDAPPADPALLAALGELPLLVAASTHAGEEEAVLAAFQAARADGRPGLLLLAPRHADRFDTVAGVVRAAGLPLRRRSALGGAPLAAGEVLLLDSVGELSSLFGRASLAFVGGSLVPRGGHNVLEPVQAGCPVVLGPHVENVRHALALLEPVGACARVEGPGLVAAFRDALADPGAARRRGAAGLAALAPARGATERSVALVEEVLGA
jgi:3-deoxy-D-manno-octulosonic-acid transferase